MKESLPHIWKFENQEWNLPDYTFISSRMSNQRFHHPLIFLQAVRTNIAAYNLFNVGLFNVGSFAAYNLMLERLAFFWHSGT